ncbi:MAG: hydroxymethylbilane synthase [Bacteroidetes bacterium]|nr:MAG: hydroxymethylbilane synthase [Bacteroidota bacterium]TAG90076.1 MAG: hydroxymethylbilane synthase [Bacteroidota bacterium]
MLHFRLGTRSSPLALWQANFVADILKNAGATIELVQYETVGDKILNRSLAEIGNKGLFTEELEQDLRLKNTDLAVHSAKDVQSVLDDDLELLAFCERELANDVVMSFDKNVRLSLLNENQIVGTSSTRRKAFLKYYFPILQTAEVRGNLQTRIKKLENGQYKAILLAYAGVRRAGLESLIVEKLDLQQFTPAVGQGSVAIETHKELAKEKKDFLKKHLNHHQTSICLETERAFLATLEGGCSIPIFGYAHINSAQKIVFEGGIISLNGKEMIKIKEISTENPIIFGKKLAEKLLNQGGDKILAEIKKVR